jgi:tRNA(Ile)-lysidine synthase
LKFRKEELLAFATQEHLNWVEDSSNCQEKYSRNYFRNSFIPFVKKVYPNAEDNLLDNIERFREIEILYRQSIEKQKNQLLTLKEDEIHIPVLKLKKSVPLNTLIYEILKPYHFSSQQVNEVVHLLNSEQGKYVQSPTHRVIKNRNWIIISPNQSASPPFIIIEQIDEITEFANGSIRCEIFPAADFKIPVSPGIACLDASSIEFPLILRKWKQGDYFYPLGMKKKKKLSRFLIDLKCSPTEKEKTWVLEMRRKIIWVVNLRIDERFRITDRTKKILKISFGAQPLK